MFLTIISGLLQEQIAAYRINLPALEVAPTLESSLVFSLADGGLELLPEDIKAELADIDDSEPIDLSIELIDRDGNSAVMPFSHHSLLQPRIESHLGKASFMQTIPISEAVFQSFEFRLADFAAVNPFFNPSQVRVITLIFDRSLRGVVLLRF